MMKHLLISLTLLALIPNAAHTADRATVEEQVAEKCREDYPDPDYVTQLGCRHMHMEAYDKLQQQDQERKKSRKSTTPEKKPQGE
jgi:hypothetical protein